MLKRLDLLTSLLLTAPVFLVYHLGILLIHYRNGVDWVTDLTFRLLESNIPAYIALTISVVIALALFCYFRHGEARFQRPLFGRVLAESFVWALVMLFSVAWATAQIQARLLNTTVFPRSPDGMGATDKIVIAAGAGFHEEMVFRLGILEGSFALLKSYKMHPGVALGVASLVSATLFAAAHHIGPSGDELTVSIFAFRALAGLFLGLVHVVRGFAVAVYTHMLYDILVFFVFA